MINAKKVFVTGASGMLDNSICKELLTQGYPVKATCLSNNKSETLDGLKIEKILGDVAGKENQYISSEKAKEELNMPQTPIGEKIERTMELFKVNRYL